MTRPSPSRSGEVTVKRHGHVHAVDAPELSGRINVDVDGEHVTVPSDVDVSFNESDDTRVYDSEEVEADGGQPVERSDVELRGGVALDREPAHLCIGFAVLGLLSGGYLWGQSGAQPLIGAVVAAGSLALGWVATGSYWRWRGEGE